MAFIGLYRRAIQGYQKLISANPPPPRPKANVQAQINNFNRRSTSSTGSCKPSRKPWQRSPAGAGRLQQRWRDGFQLDHQGAADGHRLGGRLGFRPADVQVVGGRPRPRGSAAPLVPGRRCPGRPPAAARDRIRRPRLVASATNDPGERTRPSSSPGGVPRSAPGGADGRPGRRPTKGAFPAIRSATPSPSTRARPVATV